LMVGVGLASFTGTLLGELLSAKPVAGAPDSEKIDYMIRLLEELVRADGLILDSMASILDRLDLISDKLVSGGGVFPASILTPWVAGDPDLIYEESLRNAGTFFTTKRVDFRRGKRLALRAENTLDQPVILQAIGNFTDSVAGATDIGLAVPCLAAGNANIGVWGDDWQPYIAVRMTIALAPTNGVLRIYSVMQE